MFSSDMVLVAVETSQTRKWDVDITSPGSSGECLSSLKASEDNQFENANTGKSTLLGLPSEIRLLIYAYTFHDSILSYNMNGKVLYQPPQNMRNALCRVNKGFRDNATPHLINATKTLTDSVAMRIPRDAESQIAIRTPWELNMDAQYFRTIQTLLVNVDCALEPPYAQLPKLRKLVGYDPGVHAYCHTSRIPCNATPDSSTIRSGLRTLYLDQGRGQPIYPCKWPASVLRDSGRTAQLWFQMRFVGDYLELHYHPKWVPTRTTWEQASDPQ